MNLLTPEPPARPGGRCNLYWMRVSAAEVASFSDAHARESVNFGEEVYPGCPGLVAAEGVARTMSWGFPLQLAG